MAHGSPGSGDIILFSLTERPDGNIVVTYGTHRSSHGPAAGAEAVCRDVGEDPGPGPAAPQTRPEAEADGVISMMSPDPPKMSESPSGSVRLRVAVWNILRGEAGQRWSERIWYHGRHLSDARQACAMQHRSVFEYLHRAIRAHFTGAPAPSLLPAGS